MRYSAEEKAALVLESLRGTKSITELHLQRHLSDIDFPLVMRKLREASKR